LASDEGGINFAAFLASADGASLWHCQVSCYLELIAAPRAARFLPFHIQGSPGPRSFVWRLAGAS
jgi:hypothetical protein